MKASELEGLQEEAYAAHHQGEYSAAIAVLERAIEVGVEIKIHVCGGRGFKENANDHLLFLVFFYL